MTKNQQQTIYLGPEAVASISFLRSEELMFTWREEDKIQSKLISHEAAVLAFNTTHTEDSGWLPENVLRTGRNVRGAWAVYVTRPQMVQIVTDQDEKLNIPIPATLFLGWGSRYYLWALPNKKFNPSLPVFRAPFPNIYSNGRICWGNHKVPKAKAANIGRVWKTFFDTAFNEHISNNKCKSCSNTVLELLRRLSAESATVFPQRELIGEYATVENCLHNTLQHGGD
jgi:PRTRC genetic system protein B